jgi:DNA-binding transcriptional MocR family regulator
MSERLRCSKCGKPAACSCGAPYVSKLEYIAMHMDLNKSDRANARELGVSDKTVAKAGKQLRKNSAVETKRKGRDGKLRALPKKNGSGRSRGRRPAWATPPRRRKGETRAEYNERWGKLNYERRLKELPDVQWMHEVDALLIQIVNLEKNWEEKYGNWRRFSMEPCSYKLLQQAAAVLNGLLSQLHHQPEEEHEHVVRH